MTLTQRNIVLNVNFFLFLFLTVGTLIFCLPIMKTPNYLSELSFSFAQSYWGFTEEINFDHLLFLLSIAFKSGFSLFAYLIILVSFRKTLSPEIFFFSFFILFFSVDVLKLFLPLLDVMNYHPILGGLITRICYAGKVFQLICLFFSGIYLMGFEYRNYGLLLAIALGIAGGTAGLLLLDYQKLGTNLLYSLNGEDAFFFYNTALMALPLVSFLWIALRKKEKDYTGIFIAAVVLILSQELLFFSFSYITIASGAALLIAGCILFSRSVHNLYLWT